MIGSNDRRRWLPVVGAAVALTLALAACGDDTPAATSGAAEPEPQSTSADGDGNATPAPVSLDDALSAVGSRYAFTASVTLAESEVTRVSGTVYDGTGAYLVTAGGSDVEYVVSDQGQWAREPGGEWTALSDAAPLSDPLAPLRNPLTTVVTQTGDDATIEAVYDGATLGFASVGEVTVTVSITDGAVTSISYDALVGQDVATVVTTFDGTADVAPIEVPPT